MFLRCCTKFFRSVDIFVAVYILLPFSTYFRRAVHTFAVRRMFLVHSTCFCRTVHTFPTQCIFFAVQDIHLPNSSYFCRTEHTFATQYMLLPCSTYFCCTALDRLCCNIYGRRVKRYDRMRDFSCTLYRDGVAVIVWACLCWLFCVCWFCWFRLVCSARLLVFFVWLFCLRVFALSV